MPHRPWPWPTQCKELGHILVQKRYNNILKLTSTCQRIVYQLHCTNAQEPYPWWPLLPLPNICYLCHSPFILHVLGVCSQPYSQLIQFILLFLIELPSVATVVTDVLRANWIIKPGKLAKTVRIFNNIEHIRNRRVIFWPGRIGPVFPTLWSGHEVSHKISGINSFKFWQSEASLVPTTQTKWVMLLYISEKYTLPVLNQREKGDGHKWGEQICEASTQLGFRTGNPWVGFSRTVPTPWHTVPVAGTTHTRPVNPAVW